MPLPFPLLAAALWFATKGLEKKSKDAAQLKLVPVDVELKSEKDIKLKMQVINPTDSEFKIDALSANIFYGTKIIGTVERKTPFTIKPTDNSIIAFQVRPETGEAIAAMITLLFNKKAKAADKTFKILGWFKYYGLTFPIEKTIPVNV